MANTFVNYTWNTSDPNSFTVPFAYLSKDHVYVYVNSVEDSVFTWLTDSSIAVSVTLSDGDQITVQRTTPRNALQTVIPNSGTFRGVDINNQSLQALYIADEAYDYLGTVLSLDGSDNTWDADTKRIKNVVDPVNAQDAVTKNWAETAMSSQLASAIAQASAAATSASNAASSASAAATSETNAATSETNAASSASAASTSASNASTSETNAASSASAASTSASNAATSASNAASSASAAATSASNAATSETNAAASYDSFDDRYLGSKTADPSTDNDGNTLLVGAIYWNSVSSVMKAWNGSAWDQVYFDSAGFLPLTGGALTGDVTSTADLILEGNVLAGTIQHEPQVRETITLWQDNTNVTTNYASAARQFNATAHPFVADDLVYIESTGTLPAGASADTPYYVQIVNANAFQLSTSFGSGTGHADCVVLTSDGTGTHTVYKPVRMVSTTLDVESDGSVVVKSGSVYTVV